MTPRQRQDAANARARKRRARMLHFYEGTKMVPQPRTYDDVAARFGISKQRAYELVRQAVKERTEAGSCTV